MLYGDVFKAFDEKSVRYIVVGAIAMNLHGAPRMTADLDIVADLGNENLSLLLDTVTELGYRPRLPVPPRDLLSPAKREQWKREKGLVVFTFIHPEIRFQEIDLLIASAIPFHEADRMKSTITVESFKIPVLSINHLIEMKRLAGRKQDLSDIEVLQRILDLQSKGD